MSTIAAGTTTGTALVTSGDTTGQLVLQTNGTTTAVTIGTNQVVTLAQPLPVASGGTGSTTGVNLATGVTGTLPIANGGTGTTSTTFVNLASNVTGTLPVANGGTGASSLTANNVLLGNGTSALQTVAPGANGNVLRSNGTTWTSAAVSSGALTLLQTVTASSSATVELETGIGSTYDFYLITFTNVRPDSLNRQLLARMKLGGSYLAANYLAMANGGYSYGSGGLASNQQFTAAIQLTLSTIPATSGFTGHGELWFSSPANTSIYKHVNWVCGVLDSSGLQTLQGTGANYDASGTAALTGIQFFFIGTNVGTGVFRLYGFSNS